MEHPAMAYVRKGALKGMALGGIGAGAAGAALGGLPKKNLDGSERSKAERIARGVAGAVGFGGLGVIHGGRMGAMHHAKKWVAGKAPQVRPKVPAWLHGAKNKAEAKSLYKAQARKLHPDLHGGSDEAIKKLNIEWDAHEPHFKTAMLHALADELEKIAAAKTAMGLGAVLGGVAGYKLAPNTLKGKAVGAAGGALAGNAVGNMAAAAKRAVYDDPRAYEQAQLYGYGGAPPPPTNFY